MKKLLDIDLQKLEDLTKELVHKAFNEFQSSTQQSYYAELRVNIEKNIEPSSIRCNQQLLQEQFEEDVYAAAHETATVQVQHQLLESTKAFFDRETRTNTDATDVSLLI